MSDRLIEKRIDLPEYQTTYLDGGDAVNSTPILFLHGWTTSTAPYRESLNLLSQHHRVIAPDLPGFGKCTYPKRVPTHMSYVSCIIALLKALNLPKIHIIGHSGGGAVAIALAATQPTFVNSLIVSDSTGIPLGALPVVALRRLVGMVLQTPKILPVPMLRFYQALLYNWISKPQNMIQATRLALEKDLRSLMPQIQSPTLVLWGERDRFIPVEFGYELFRQIPGAQIMIAEGEYHEWVMFRPQKFIPLVCQFLHDVEQGSTLSIEEKE
jgi:abhydrolase domain-containing protein 6